MTTQPDPHAIARTARLVAVVLIATFVFWVGAQWLGPRLGLAGRYALLIDFAALAAFFWAFVVAMAAWRKARGKGRL
ncbi:MAG: DUF5337 family protein [Pseudomonadota bacterium]